MPKKDKMKFLQLFLVLFLIFPSIVNGSEKKFKFALVPKNTNDNLFLEVYHGCLEASRNLSNVDCIYPKNAESNPRIQISIIKKLLEENVDGIAVSIINSDMLIKSGVFQEAQKLNIPIITFESDFSDESIQKYPDFRLSYIGSNNFKFGQELGKMLVKTKPNGGKLCIQSGWRFSSNLNERINGIRSILAKTNNEHNAKIWIESIRCPLYSNEKNATSLYQLKNILKTVDAVISVSGEAQYNKSYKIEIAKFKKELLENKKVLIMGNAEPLQVEYLKQKLSFNNVGQDLFKMGKESINTLYKIKTNQKYEKIIYTHTANCTYENYETCKTLFYYN